MSKTQILFKGTNHNFGVAVAEVKPGRHTLLAGEHRIFAPHPYIVFAMTYQTRRGIDVDTGEELPCYQPVSLQVFFRNDPLENIDDELHLSMFDNCNPSGGVCLGFHQHARCSLSEAMDDAVDMFWQTNFSGYGTRVNQLGGVTFRELANRDSSEVLKIDWGKHTTYLLERWTESAGNSFKAPGTVRNLATKWEDSS